jgi:hypothetical protein
MQLQRLQAAQQQQRCGSSHHQQQHRRPPRRCAGSVAAAAAAAPGGAQQPTHQQQQQPAVHAALPAIAAAAALVLQACLPLQQASAATLHQQQPQVPHETVAATWGAQPVLGDVSLAAAAAPEVGGGEDMTLQEIEDDIMADMALPPELRDFMELLQKVWLEWGWMAAGQLCLGLHTHWPLRPAATHLQHHRSTHRTLSSTGPRQVGQEAG